MISSFSVLLEFSIVATAVVSGVFLAFSDFIMRSLGRSEITAGVEVMQVINREVFRTVFMVLLIGMSFLSLVLVGYAYLWVNSAVAIYVIPGGVIYFVGVFLVSLVFNIPMNNALEARDYREIEAATYWVETYLPRWTFWNYVRAISAAVSSACFLVALLQLA